MKNLELQHWIFTAFLNFVCIFHANRKCTFEQVQQVHFPNPFQIFLIKLGCPLQLGNNPHFRALCSPFVRLSSEKYVVVRKRPPFAMNGNAPSFFPWVVASRTTRPSKVQRAFWRCSKIVGEDALLGNQGCTKPNIGLNYFVNYGISPYELLTTRN